MQKILKRPADQKLVCTTLITLGGVRFSPGDPLSREVLAKLPPRNLNALISTGAVTYLAEIHPEESDLHRQRRECQIELASVKAVLTRIQSDKLQAIQQIEELAQKRAADALAEYREGGPKSDGSELRKTRDALVDLGAAESQAIQEIARLESEIKILDRRAELTRAGKVRDQRVELCKEITAGIDRLAPLFKRFAETSGHFERLVRSGSGQIASDWRLKNLIDERLLFHAIPVSLKVTDLAAIEGRIYSDVLDRAVRAAEKQGD